MPCVRGPETPRACRTAGSGGSSPPPTEEDRVSVSRRRWLRYAVPPLLIKSTLRRSAMLTIKRILESATCVFCNAEKEAASVVMEGHGQGELQLCWSCLKKMARMK